jgi:hypothetical protein
MLDFRIFPQYEASLIAGALADLVFCDTAQNSHT